MKQKGFLNFILLVLVVFLIAALLPPIIMMLFPPADLLMRVFLVFLIFTTVRGYLGNSVLTLVISGILIYVLVIKWAYLTASLYIIFNVFLMFSVFSMLLWGLSSLFRPH